MPGKWAKGVEEIFTSDVECEQKYANFVKRALKFTILNPILDNGDTPLRVQLLFEPLRPVHLDASLVIIKQSGGRCA